MDLSNLEELIRTESSTVEWKESGDPEAVVKKLTAFANGETGGWVLCGLKEEKDDHGFRRARPTGIRASEFKRLKERVPKMCWQVVSPPLVPQVTELRLESDPERRLLVFWVAASPHAHSFRIKRHETYWINSDSHTIEARGDLLRDLLQRKERLPPFLDGPCAEATMDDVNRAAVEEFVTTGRLPRAAAEYLEPDVPAEGTARPLVVSRASAPGRSSATPTYLSILLFGREPARFLSGASLIFTVYPGTTRTTATSQRFETTGTIPQVIRDVMGRLRLYTGIAVDKSADALKIEQNRPRYSESALQEALVNALAHRDYTSPDPTRVTVFEDHIELANPGGVAEGVNTERLLAGKGYPTWRNPGLASFLIRMGWAQSLGQGLGTIRQATYLVSGLEPEFHVDAASFTVSIPAYRPPSTPRRDLMLAADRRREGLILIAIGAPSIQEAVETCLPDLGLEGATPVVDFTLPSYVDPTHPWDLEARRIRNEVRRWVENPGIDRLHLFYRGPVALAPLLGALVAPAKPLVVYHYEEGRYSVAYVLDRRFLRSED